MVGFKRFPGDTARVCKWQLLQFSSSFCSLVAFFKGVHLIYECIVYYCLVRLTIYLLWTPICFLDFLVLCALRLFILIKDRTYSVMNLLPLSLSLSPSLSLPAFIHGFNAFHCACIIVFTILKMGYAGYQLFPSAP